MESEDDMHDANDLESLEDFYSGDSDDAAHGDYDFIDNYSEDDFDDFAIRRNQVILAILLKFLFSIRLFFSFVPFLKILFLFLFWLNHNHTALRSHS